MIFEHFDSEKYIEEFDKNDNYVKLIMNNVLEETVTYNNLNKYLNNDFIKNLNPTDEELLKYKIGAIGSSDAVLHVKDKGESARSLYLRGLSYEERKNKRDT